MKSLFFMFCLVMLFDVTGITTSMHVAHSQSICTQSEKDEAINARDRMSGGDCSGACDDIYTIKVYNARCSSEFGSVDIPGNCKCDKYL